MTRQWIINWKECGRKWSRPNFKILGGAQEKHENYIQNSWCHGQDLNKVPLQYKSKPFESVFLVKY
jgi:hypothetical protein